MKQVKITFSFQLPYYIGLFSANDGSDKDCPIITISDVNIIRIEHIKEEKPFSDSSGILFIPKSIIHISMLRNVGDKPDLNDIKKIYVEAFKILISFLQLFRLRTREFTVNPAEIIGPLSLDEDPKFCRRKLIYYNPQWIEKIAVNCEPECSLGGNAIRKLLHALVGGYITPGHRSACCNEPKWREIGQELSELLKNNSYKFDSDELLANELLTEAYRFIGGGYPPFPEDPLRNFQYPSPGLCAGILNIAVACEIYVKGYVRKEGRPVYKSILENHRDFTMPVTNYLDYVIKDIVGISLKDKCRDLWDNIQLLFQLRNRIVHSGKATIPSNSKNKHQVNPHDVFALGKSVETTIEWLKSPDKYSFSFGDVSKLRTQITSRQT